jgi:hypothetical protein
MSFNYNSVVGRGSGRVTLPSVESWGESMSILKDPSKGIQTRRVDRVGQTSEIVQMIQEAGSRISGLNDTILVYPRGVNQMVAVDYSNNGNSGGQRGGSSNNVGLNIQNSSGRQSYLPYRILDKGSFRPPIRDQRELLPLSRLPRVWTSSFTQPGFTDFSKKASCPNPIEMRAMRDLNKTLKSCEKPLSYLKIESPADSFTPKQRRIKTIGKKEGYSEGHYSEGHYSEDPEEDYLSVPDIRNKNNLQTDVNINRSYFTKDGENEVQIENYTKDNFNIDHTTNFSGYDKNEYIHDDIILQKSIPTYQASTNRNQNIFKRLDNQVTERVYKPNTPNTSMQINPGMQRKDLHETSGIDRVRVLKPTIQGDLNQFNINSQPYFPKVEMEHNAMINPYKQDFRKKIYEMQHDRTVSQGQIPYGGDSVFG